MTTLIASVFRKRKEKIYTLLSKNIRQITDYRSGNREMTLLIIHRILIES